MVGNGLISSLNRINGTAGNAETLPSETGKLLATAKVLQSDSVSQSPYKARPSNVITSGIKVIEGPKDI